MRNIKELENALLDQIEKLNDDSIAEDEEKAKTLIERSRAMSELADSYIGVCRMKLGNRGQDGLGEERQEGRARLRAASSEARGGEGEIPLRGSAESGGRSRRSDRGTLRQGYGV